MSKHKSMDIICVIAIVFSVLISIVMMNSEIFGIQIAVKAMGYEDRLFDTDKVHTMDIVIDDWDTFISTCQSEEYSDCAVVIDGEAYKNVAIRGKGNTSLSTVSSMNSERYSFKLEFDHFDNNKTYHGLDKLCLNNIIQDNTYMKDYLTYQLMYSFGVDAPLCSFTYITVNGEDWGLYLAVEGIEDAFLERNYGSDYGELYKPDSMSFGGGRGNGKGFNMDDFDMEDSRMPDDADTSRNPFSQFKGGGFNFGSQDDDSQSFGEMTPPDSFDPGNIPSDIQGGNKGGMQGFGMGSSDVKLQYIDDDPDSYSNIFSNAKTDISDTDKNRLISSLKALSEYSDTDSVVNTEEVIRYFVVHNFVCNGDSYTGSMIHNYYLYEEDSQLSMIPWDYNLAYGTFQASNAESQVNTPIDTPVSGDMSDRPMVNWIFEDEEYTALYHELFAEFLESTDFTAIIDKTAALIAPYVEKDPTKFCTYEEFETGVKAIRSFCELREESVSGQLSGTIPSTSEGQSADSSSLVKTDDLTLSDMGSMGGMGGMGKSQSGGHKFGGSEQNDDKQSDDTQEQVTTTPSLTNLSVSSDSGMISQYPSNHPHLPIPVAE